MSADNINQNSLYGVIIKVENLDVCRSFYRDILELGPPVIDSNFWVEFELQEKVSLVLEQAAQNEKLPAGHGRTSWLYYATNMDRLVKKLKAHGYEPLYAERERIGYKVHTFCDPEGNHFYLFSKEEIR